MSHWFRSLHPLQRLAVVVWVAMFVGVAGRVAFSKPGSQSVVPIYREAAHDWLRGDNLYHWEPPRDIYRNPPGFAALFVPFAMLPEKTTEIAWRAGSAVVFLLGLGRWVRHGLPRPLTPGETGAVFLLAAPLGLASLNNGQTNLILIGLLLLGATAATQQRWRTAGAWLAAAAALKVYPLAVGLLIGLGAPRRLLPWLAGWCVLLAAIPFVLHDPAYVLEQHRNFRTAVTVDDRTFHALPRAPRDLFLVLRVWFTPPTPQVYLGLKLAAAAGMAGLVLLIARRTRDMQIVAPLALHLGCVWITVLGPATETHTYTLLAPTSAVVLVLSWANRSRPPRLGGPTLLALLGYGLLVSPIFRDMFPNGTQYQILGPQPVGGLIVLAVVVWEALRSAPQRDAPTLPITSPAFSCTRKAG